MRCRLTRLGSVHRNLRTNVVVGNCAFAPIQGLAFIMTGKPLNPNATFRFVQTSRIDRVTPSEKEDALEFQTQNSVYKWERLAKQAPVAQSDRAAAS